MARGRPIKCVYCGGRTIAKGNRKTQTMGLRPLRKCKQCGRRFTYVKKPPKASSAPREAE